MEIEPFSYCSMITKTLNLSNKKYKLVKLDQCSHIKKSKAPWNNYIHSPQDGGNIVVVLHIYGARAIFLLFCDNQDTESD